MGALKMPAQPHAASLAATACGAESVPRKNFASPEVAASRSASRCALALDHRQAVDVRADAAVEHGVAVDCRWCGVMVAATLRRHALARTRRLRGGDVFEHRPSGRGNRAAAGASTRSMNTASRSKMSTSAAVTSPWTSSGMPIFSIRFQHRIDVAEIGDAVGGIGGGVRRVELGGGEHAVARSRAPMSSRIGVVGEIGRHQRREADTPAGSAARMRAR